VPDCHLCQHLEPVWSALAHNTTLADRGFHFGTIDCETDPALAAQLQVRGYPSLRL